MINIKWHEFAVKKRHSHVSPPIDTLGRSTNAAQDDSGPRRERQILRLRLVVNRRLELDHVRVGCRPRIPRRAQDGEGGVGSEEVLLLAWDVGLLDEVDVHALALRIDTHLATAQPWQEC